MTFYSGAGASRGWLTPFLLLSLRGRALLGSELTGGIQGLGFWETRPGEVYRVLGEVEKEGVVATLRDGGGSIPLERRYEITPAGEVYLVFWANSLEGYRGEMELFLKAYARLNEADGEPVRVREGRA